MRKVLLVVLVLWGNAAPAQSVSLGGDVGITWYNFRQLPYSLTPSEGLLLNVFAQYIFKDNSFGIEYSAIYNLNSPPQPVMSYGQTSADPYSNYNFINAVYFIYNPFNKLKTVKLQVKGGLFYSPLIGDYNHNFKDWGPAVQIYCGIKVHKHWNIGVDFSELIGTQYFIFYSYDNGEPLGKSQISYTMFQISLLYKI